LFRKVDILMQGFFVTVLAGTACRHLFSKVKKKIFVKYIFNEQVIFS